MKKTITLANGVEMPIIGLGVFKVEDGEQVEQSIKYAIDAGYTSIDTAKIYANEVGVGKAIKKSGIPRSELFITSKLWNDDQGYNNALEQFELSLKRLGLEYLDLYLIHWPVDGLYKESWRALEKLYASGKVRAIGVSNFHQHHLDNLLEDAEVTPMINQVEMHPRLAQNELRKYCEQRNIVMEAWGPLGQGNLIDNVLLKSIGNKYGKSSAQIMLRWHIQRNTIVIPKSVSQHRIEENIAIFDFELTAEDMLQIATLNTEERFGRNPESYDTENGEK